METKEDLRRIILGQMCETIQDIERNKTDMNFYSLFVDNYYPPSFKPGVSDKLLFNKMIDKIINVTYEETSKLYSKKITLHGLHVLSRYYFPYYSWCDELELEKAKNNTNL